LREPFRCHEENEIRPLDARPEKAEGHFHPAAMGLSQRKGLNKRKP